MFFIKVKARRGHILRSNVQHAIFYGALHFKINGGIVIIIISSDREPSIGSDMHKKSFEDGIIRDQLGAVKTGIIIYGGINMLFGIEPYAVVGVPALLKKETVCLHIRQVIIKYDRVGHSLRNG